MLRSLRVVDFKGIRELEVSLRPLTVFVGANGVGKTTLLEAVYAVGLAARPDAGPTTDSWNKGRWARNYLTRSGAPAFGVRIVGDVASADLLVPRPKHPPLLLTMADQAQYEVHRAEDGSLFPLTSSSRRLEESEAQFLSTLRTPRRLRLDPETIAAPAAVPTGKPVMAKDGAGLSAVLQYENGLRDGTIHAIEAAVQTVVPRFRRVQFRPTSIHEVKTEYLSVEGQQVPRVVERDVPGVELLVAFDDGAVVPAAHVSEGTLLTLAILTIAHQDAGIPRVVLIDDIDRALHPAAQHQLMAALYKVLAAAPGLQILATTHSPDLVDACAAEDVRVLARDAEGNTAARALSEHPEAEKWLKLLRVGEFWGTVGEDWVTARTPSP